MRWLRSVCLIGLSGSGLLATLVSADASVDSPNGARRWIVTQTQSPSEQANYLSSTVSIGMSDVWAVGAWYRPDLSTPGTLTEHWNGSSWNVVPSPNATDGYNELYGVDGVSSDDVWAVGYHNISYWGTERTMALHWNGRRWSITKTRNLGSTANELEDVSALAGNDVWAVGFGDDPGGFMGKAIAEHWDGSNWHLVNVAPPGSGGSELSAVDAVAPDDVWAVGTHAGSTLTEHFDGTAWSVVPSPNGDLGDGILSAVVAIAPDDVWAAGATGSDGGSRAASRGDGGGGGGGETTLILHWDGSQWTVVPSPNGPNPSNVLDDLVAFGPNKVWAGGSSYDDLAVTSRSLVERWDGTGWRVVKSPNPDPDYTTLIGIGGRGPRDLWAVGAQGRLTLALHR